MARTGSKSRTVHKGRGTRSKVVVSVSKQKKNTWTRQEDQRLLEAINDYDTDTKTPWVLIAKKCPGRSSKQCRERWMNHLRPDVKKGNWTEAEDRAIVELQQTLGNRWSAMAKILKRSDNDIKNRWNSQEFIPIRKRFAKEAFGNTVTVITETAKKDPTAAAGGFHTLKEACASPERDVIVDMTKGLFLNIDDHSKQDPSAKSLDVVFYSPENHPGNFQEGQKLTHQDICLASTNLPSHGIQQGSSWDHEEADKLDLSAFTSGAESDFNECLFGTSSISLGEWTSSIFQNVPAPSILMHHGLTLDSSFMQAKDPPATSSLLLGMSGMYTNLGVPSLLPDATMPSPGGKGVIQTFQV